MLSIILPEDCWWIVKQNLEAEGLLSLRGVSKDLRDLISVLDIKKKWCEDKTLIEIAQRGFTDILIYMVREKHIPITREVVIAAAENGHTETVRACVELGGDIRAIRNTPIINAARNGHAETVRVCAELGADIQAQHNKALISASTNGYLETVKVCLELGADISAREFMSEQMAELGMKYETMLYLKKLREDRGDIITVKWFIT